MRKTKEKIRAYRPTAEFFDRRLAALRERQ
jgi:hypothetical protein